MVHHRTTGSAAARGRNALEAEQLNRDLILPAVGFFGATGPLSDAAPLSLAGVPIVSLITTPLYLFDPCDTVDKVDTAVTGVGQCRGDPHDRGVPDIDDDPDRLTTRTG